MTNKYLEKLAESQDLIERFKPDLTPSEMEELGVLASQYYDADPKEHNFFKVDASLKKWPEYWKSETAPQEWFQWFKQYSSGVRTPDDDRQIKRWILFKARHLGGLRKADPTLQDLSIRPKQRQALLNWGITGGMTKDQLTSKAQEMQKQASAENYVRHKYSENDWSHLENPVGTKKYDGAHFILTVQPDGKLTYHSRRQSVHGHYPERSEQLPHLNDKALPEFAGDQYAVELIHTGHEKTERESHPTVSGILNSKKDRAIATQADIGPVRAVLLDVKSPKLETYGDKIRHMLQFQNAYGKSDLLYAPEVAYGQDAINKYLNKITTEGGEGMIVTDLHAPENKNLRYKIKNYQPYNLKVKGLTQEIDISGKPKLSMGAAILVDATGRVVGKVGSGFDRKTRIEAWHAPELWNDKLIQVRAYPPSIPGGQIRFPVYNGEGDSELDTVVHL
jgi:hypothetical protein